MEKSKTQELIKAFDEGFIYSFEFLNGQLYCMNAPTKFFNPKDIEIHPMPCFIAKHIVYRITTPDGIKGIAINHPDDCSNDF